MCIKDYSWNPSMCNCENSKHSKHIADDSRIGCDEIMYEKINYEKLVIKVNHEENVFPC